MPGAVALRAAGFPGAFVVRGATTRGAALEVAVTPWAPGDAGVTGATVDGATVRAAVPEGTAAVGEVVSRAAFPPPPPEEQAVRERREARARGTRRVRT